MTNLAVFASGTGSNFDAIQKAIEDGTLQAQIVLLVCDQPHALVLQKAQAKNIPAFVFESQQYASKQEYEAVILEACHLHQASLLVLAGYMRLLGNTLLAAYPNRIVNIHPSLLPAFKGKDAIGQAISYGVKVMGVTIHYVDHTMDGGAIISQESFAVLPAWTRAEIEAQVHQIEHRLYPNTLQRLLEEQQ